MPVDPSDSAPMPLRDALARGEPASAERDLAALYRTYSGYVAAVGLRILGRDGELDDLVQDVFVMAQRGLANVRDDAAIKGWLATIAVRRAMRQLRRRRLRRFVGLDEAPDYAALVSTEASPEVRARVARIYQALDELPAKLRVPWALRYLEGEKLTEVAERCGCSLATAKRRVASAQRHVREAVSG